MSRAASPIALATLLATTAALAEWKPDQVLISYGVRVPGGEISGVSHELRWRLDAVGEGRSKAHFAVPVRSFDSGHPEFDAVLRAALSDDAHPDVELDGIVDADKFEGTIAVRGIATPLTFKVRADHVGSYLMVSGSFVLNPRDLGVSIPGVQSAARVEFAARLAVNPTAILAGGFIGAGN